MYFFISIVIFFSFMLNHPLFLSVNLLFLSMMVMISILDSNYSSWFTILLCLIYLGGILILFVYISSFLPNIKSIMNLSFYELMMIIMVISAIFMTMKMGLSFSFFSIKSLSLMNINFIFMKKMMSFMFIMILYMIIILMFSVYLISFNKFPLREM